jgi:enoyl-CoA hydratase
MTNDCFDVTIESGVAHIQMKRPEAMNSMIRAFWRELPAIVHDIDDNAKARCIVISSTGKHFSAGMDLAVFTGGASPVAGGSTGDRYVAAEAGRHGLARLHESFSCLEAARMPVLVAVQGGCIGDVRYATADAFFCIQEINIGMTADVGTFPRLCKLIPDGWVKELAYTGARLPAARAREIGLVNEVFDTQEAMLAHVLTVAHEIASKSPLAVTGSKVMINYARDHTQADALDYLVVWQASMFAGPHMGEAFMAKKEGRAPMYPDLLPKAKALSD